MVVGRTGLPEGSGRVLVFSEMGLLNQIFSLDLEIGHWYPFCFVP